MDNTIYVIVAFVVYTALMILIGGIFFNKSKTMSDYFLGGRGLNPFVAGISAQASDMSGWLLMGLPGAIYSYGTGQIWIAVGLLIGTILNWLIVAKPLRHATIIHKDSITLPEYFENRFNDKSKTLRTLSALIIGIFFSVYTASAFVAGATLFNQVFGLDYHMALLIGAGIILVYTFLGGFSAVSWTDLFQGLLMFLAIISVPLIVYFVIKSPNESYQYIKLPDNFLDFFGDGNDNKLGFIDIISQLGWGLGYFGMPHILVRFMAIRKEKEVKFSAIVAIVWVTFSLFFACIVGVLGKIFLPNLENSETVFIAMIKSVFLNIDAIIPFPIIGGLFICGILAAIMSTADSQLLVTASALTRDIYNSIINKKASNEKLILFSRGFVLLIAFLGIILAWNKDSSVMELVSNAWAGFGATFGPVILVSIYYKNMSKVSAIIGIISGALIIIIWEYVPLFGGEVLAESTHLYSLIPGFSISLILILLINVFKKNNS